MRRRGTLAAAALVTVVWLPAACTGTGEQVVERDWTGATALTGSEDHAMGVATDGTVAVFSTGGSQVGENAVRAVDLDGSGPSRVLVTAPLDGIPRAALAIVGDTVYVAVGKGIAAVPLAGGAATAVVGDRPAVITSLAVDATHVWWTTSQLNSPKLAEVGRVPLAGGPVEVLAGPEAGGGSYSSVAPDGTGAAYVGSPNGIVRVGAGRDPELVVSSDEATGAVTRVAVADGRLFGAVAGGRNDLFTVPVDGGPLTELARDVDNTKDVLPVDGGVAFFVGDDLRWVPATGGKATTLASGPYSEGSLARAGDRLVFPADWKLWTAPLPASGG